MSGWRKTQSRAHDWKMFVDVGRLSLGLSVFFFRVRVSTTRRQPIPPPSSIDSSNNQQRSSTTRSRSSHESSKRPKRETRDTSKQEREPLQRAHDRDPHQVNKKEPRCYTLDERQQWTTRRDRQGISPTFTPPRNPVPNT